MRFIRSWWEHDITHLAAALAYYAVFSFPALLLLILAVGGALVGDETIRAEAFATIDRYVAGDAGELLKSTVEGITLPGRGLLMSAVGAIGLLIGGTAIIREAQAALYKICGPRKTPLGAMPARLIRGFLAVPVVCALLLAALASSIVLTLARSEAAAFVDLSPATVSAANAALSLVTLTALLFALYALLIPKHLPASSLFCGACVASVMLVLSKSLIGTYVNVSDLGAAYGVAASLLILLLWTYVAAIIFLTGAEIAAAVGRKPR